MAEWWEEPLARVVDVHTHVVPAHIPARANASRHWPIITLDGNEAGDAAVVIDGRVFRRIDSRCWDVARRLADMREDGSDMHVLSPMPELLSHWMAPDEAEALTDAINADIARMISEAPGRFAGIGSVVMQDVPRAVRGLERLKAMGFRGIEIGTHISGTPLGDASLFPIYEAAASLDLCIFVHPLHPAGVERIGRAPEYAAVAAFPLETALAAVSLLASGVLTRFPTLRVLLSHGGGALPWILPRLDHGRTLGGSVTKDFAHPPSELAKRFWYDTILYSDASLHYLRDTIGADRIVVGSDYPFAIMQTKPGTFATSALRDETESLLRNTHDLLKWPRGMGMQQDAAQ